MKIRPEVRLQKILHYLDSHNISRERLFAVSCRKEDSVYSCICTYLSIKNTFQNRYLLYKTVKRSHALSGAISTSTPKQTFSKPQSSTPVRGELETTFGNLSAIKDDDNSSCKKLYQDDEEGNRRSCKSVKKTFPQKNLLYEFNKGSENFNETRDTIITLKEGLDESGDMSSETSCCILSELEKDAANNSNTSFANVTTDTNDIPPIIDHLNKTPKGKALPAACRNLRDNKVLLKHYSSCRVLEGTYQFSESEWNEFMAANNKYYSFVLRRKIAKYINNTCSLVIKNRRRNKRNTVIYLECIHPNCKVFKVYIEKNKILKMFSPTIDFNHFKNVTSQCRGVERDIAKRDLKCTKAFTYKLNKMQEANTAILSAGNLQGIKSDSVNRKIRSESKCALDRDKDDFIDIVKMRRENLNYVQFVAEPFQVHVFSIEQVKLVLSESKLSKNLPVLHLDATGSVIRQPQYADKACFYYAGVIRTNISKRICPIFEMISCHHDSTTIGFLLAHFRFFVLQNCKLKWPIFQSVVTDFSFALINAVCFYWNHMSLEHYLNVTYKHVKEGIVLHNSVTPIYICCAHFTKMILNDVKKFNIPDKEQCILKEILVAPFHFKKYDTVKQWLKMLVIVLKSETVTNLCKVSLNTLLSLCVDHKIAAKEQDSIKRGSSLEDLNENDPLYKASPFYRDLINNEYKEAEEEIKKECKSGGVNLYYCPVLAMQILKKYIPFLPMWSGVLYKTEYTRHSNAEVENWNGILKNTILSGEKNCKASRLIRKTRNHILNVCKEACYNIQKEKLTRKDGKEGLGAMEMWKKRNHRESKFAYHKLLNLRRLRNKVEEQVNNTNSSLISSVETCNASHVTVKEINASLYDKPLLTCLDNGLVADSEYYQVLPNIKSYTVCYFSETQLSINDYMSIEESPTTKAFCTVLRVIHETYNTNKKNVLRNFTSEEARNMQIGQADLDVLYIPVIKNNSYGLVKLDYKKRLAIYHNSFYNKGNVPSTNDLRSWKIIRKQHPSVINIFKVFELEFNNYVPEDDSIYIKHIKKTLLRSSKNVLKSCLICGFQKHGPDLENWVQCEGCFRWLHFKCASGDNISFASVAYKCDLCQLYFTKKDNFKNKSDTSIVGHYTSDEFRHCQIQHLEYRDFQCLEETENKRDMWLNNFLIDICTGILAGNNHNYTLVNCNISGMILRAHTQSVEEAENISEDQIKIIPNLQNNIIMPFNTRQNHWCLAVADVNKQKFTYIDPFGAKRKTAQHYLSIFLNTILKYNILHRTNIPLSGWRILLPQHKIQKDIYNCGIYVLMFIEKIVNQEDLMTCMEPNTFRKYLKNLLIMKSNMQ